MRSGRSGRSRAQSLVSVSALGSESSSELEAVSDDDTKDAFFEVKKRTSKGSLSSLSKRKLMQDCET